MVNLMNYITEKFQISKDIKLTNQKEILDNILSICKIKTPSFRQKTIDTIKSKIEGWIKDNNINDVDIYTIDTNQNKTYISHVPIKEKVNIIKFDEYYQKYIDIFPKGTDFTELTLYNSNRIIIDANEKGMNITIVENFTLLIIKK